MTCIPEDQSTALPQAPDFEKGDQDEKDISRNRWFSTCFKSRCNGCGAGFGTPNYRTLINIIPVMPTETGPFPTAALPEDVEAWEIFKQPKEILLKVGVNPSLLLEEGDPASGIVEAARNGNFDLVVVGHRGLSSIEAFLMGSVSNRVVTHAPCSVLVVR
jgi:nucleotide-binding universal stress UspA family protein